jgi:hypothetical protein
MTLRTRLTLWRATALAVALAAPVSFVSTHALAQNGANAGGNPAIEPSGGAAAGQVAVPEKLLQSVENFWHYGKIARYDIANKFADEILSSGAEPLVVLSAFDQVARSRQADTVEDVMIRFQGTPELKEKAAKVQEVLLQGRVARAGDPAFIRAQIERLATNEVGYGNGLANLRNSGEIAVPLLINVLRDPAQAKLHGSVQRALRDLGRYALNPLVAATDTTDYNLLPTVLLVLGDLGYDAAVPYIAKVAKDPKAPPPVKDAAVRALTQLGASPDTDPAAAFLDLAERLYYDRSALTADTRYPSANVWYWEEAGLTRKEVPLPVFNEIMATRAARRCLELGGTQEQAQSIWVAANYKREVELPAGKTDTTLPAGAPDAAFYGRASGARYLDNALARTLTDRDSAVALNVIKSLQEIGGESNLTLQDGSPLVEALSYPDRRVRFEAAFALAAALPQRPFAGQESVVPLLAEAIGQTGQPTVLLVLPSRDAVNALSEPLKADGFTVAGATDAAGLLATAQGLPAVDVIVVSEDLPPQEIERIFGLARATPKLNGSVKLVVTKTNASPFEQRKVSDKLLDTTTATDAKALGDAIKSARVKGGALPLDAEAAAAYAQKAAELLSKVAISRTQVFDLNVARNQLLSSLNDARPEIVKLSGSVLGYIPAKEAQQGLLAKVQAEGVADDVKVSLLRSLAVSAKFNGNLLEAGDVEKLNGLLGGEASNDVKGAAAEARGALNLPVEQSKGFILSAPAR